MPAHENDDSIELEPSVSRQTLAETPARALQFLRGIGTNDAIRTIMFGRGYTVKDHTEGWTYLQACSGFEFTAEEQVDSGARVTQAIAELDEWDERGFRIIRATLERRFPEQAAYVFNGLSAAQGAAAVLSVSTLLDRLDQLESGTNRKDTRKEDRAAMEVLAARGITEAERARLKALVTLAGSAQPVMKPDVAAQKAKEEEKYRQALLKLRSWYVEWSEIARASFTRRDQLLALGLARRKAGARTEEPAESTEGSKG